ncbi:DUF7288 family protein [Halosimplex pelagicum]|uniref:Uncharacterized protein n=1 Tax=Halosimplex pelagicum TaxID=869886 RepID=A0A7D5T1R4_9EURY|nr:hypothetical protein [Halosimplex pelagicum]QLH80611.1 hypothetical protein HZS54_02730 [Halosimplex pelagicum]
MFDDTRGQAFTLEGLVASLVLLGALLFALQAVVVTPTTSGDVDQSSQVDLRQQADDILLLSARSDGTDLSSLVRNWSQSQRTFAGAVNPRIGYGPEPLPGNVGVMLNRTFTQRSHFFNLEITYRPGDLGNETEPIPVAYRGEPSDDAVSASYTVTLYDNQTLTAPNVSRNVELWQYDTNATNSADGYYPIPNAVEGPIYNVVEVRIVVW